MEILPHRDAVPARSPTTWDREPVVAHEKLMETASSSPRPICKNGPLAVRAVKECVHRNLRLPLKEAFEMELDYSAKVFMTEARRGARRLPREAPRRLEGEVPDAKSLLRPDASLEPLRGTTVALVGYGKPGPARR